MRFDLALRYWKEGEKLHGLCIIYVDDLLPDGDDVFKEEVALTKFYSEMKDDQEPPCEFRKFGLDYDKMSVPSNICHTICKCWKQ